MATAVFNISRAAMLINSFATGNMEVAPARCCSPRHTMLMPYAIARNECSQPGNDMAGNGPGRYRSGDTS